MKGIKKFFISLLILTAVCTAVSIPALASEGEAVREGNVFESAFTLVEENADELFSLLAFLGTLVIALLYKRGLTPTLSRGINRISASVSDIKKTFCESSEITGTLTDRISERLGRLESSLDSFSLEIIRLEELLGSQAEYRTDRESMKRILTWQIDMLSEIFMTSSLPQYQKDAVGERVRAMREALAKDEASKI